MVMWGDVRVCRGDACVYGACVGVMCVHVEHVECACGGYVGVMRGGDVKTRCGVCRGCVRFVRVMGGCVELSRGHRGVYDSNMKLCRGCMECQRRRAGGTDVVGAWYAHVGGMWG